MVVIGYNIDQIHGHHHLLVRNSWWDGQPFYWIDFYEWHDNCGLAGDVWYYTGALPPEQANWQDPGNPAVAMCDPDGDGFIGMVEDGYWCDKELGGPLSCPHQDNCPGVSNPDQSDSDCDGKGDACDPTTLDSDPDGDAIPSSIDNCPCVANRKQRDLDGDGVGDLCDDDDDNDGYKDEFDCDALNPLVGLDMDDDGFCDAYNESCDPSPACNPSVSVCCITRCNEECNRAGQLYGQHQQTRCLERCLNLDNCIDLKSNLCRPWIQCAFTQSSCFPKLEICAAKYANTDQSDLDGDGVGDLCENMPTVSDLTFQLDYGLTGAMGLPLGGWIELRQDGLTGLINFRAKGGSVSMSPFGGTPTYTSETRTGGRIGACACDLLENGEWLGDCLDPTVCNGEGELNSVTRNLAWNPINDYHCNDYPTGLLDDHLEKEPIEDHHVCHQKVFDMTKDPLDNTHSFEWSWTHSLRYGAWDQEVRDELDADARPGFRTKIRVAWPDWNRDPYYRSDTIRRQEVAYSNAVEMKVGAKGQKVHGDLYLGPEFVISKIPGVVEGGYWDDPRGSVMRPGYLLAADPVCGIVHLYGLSRGFPETARIWELGGEGISSSSAWSGATGLVQGSLIGSEQPMTTAIFLYQGLPEMHAHASVEGEDGEGDEPGFKLLIGEETEGPRVELVSTEALYAAPAPALMDAKLVFVRSLQQVLLMGRPIGSNLTVAWKLDLSEGAWEGPVRLDLEGSLESYQVVTDQRKDRVFLLAVSEVTEIDSRASLYRLDPSTLSLWKVPELEPLPARIAADTLAAFLDPGSSLIHVYGATLGSAPEGVLFILDPTARTWTRANEIVGPAFTGSPFLYHDPFRRQTWVGDFLGRSTMEPTTIGVMGQDGAWLLAQRKTLRTEPTWPFTEVYTPGSSHVYPMSIDADVEPFGQPVLATIQSQENVLSLSILSLEGDLLSAARPQAADTMAAGAVCPTRQACLVMVEPSGSPAQAAGASFQVDVKQADLVLDETVQPKSFILDLALVGNKALAAGLWGLSVLDVEPALSVARIHQGFMTKNLTSLSPCGKHLCASRLQPKGLSVYGLDEQGNVTFKGSSFTFGFGWDLAVKGAKAYVANGFFGVGIFDLSNPNAPRWIDQLWIFGHVLSVAIRRNLLAAARMNGTVIMYDLSNGEASQVGSFRAAGMVSRVRFVGGLLWILGQDESWAEVVDLSDPSSPVSKGMFTESSSERFRAKVMGTKSITFKGKKVSSYRFQPIDG